MAVDTWFDTAPEASIVDFSTPEKPQVPKHLSTSRALYAVSTTGSSGLDLITEASQLADDPERLVTLEEAQAKLYRDSIPEIVASLAGVAYDPKKPKDIAVAVAIAREAAAEAYGPKGAQLYALSQFKGEASDAIIAEEAAANIAGMILSELGSDTSDLLVDTAAWFIPDVLKDLWDKGGPQFMTNMQVTWRTLSPAERLYWLPGIVRFLMDAHDGNRQKIQADLQKYLSLDPKDFWTYGEQVAEGMWDIPDLAYGAFKLGRFASSSLAYARTNPVRTAANLGQKDLAAAQVVGSLADTTGEAAKITNHTPTDAALTMMGHAGVDPKLVKGLAPDAIRLIEEARRAVAPKLQATVDPQLLSGTTLISESERMVAQQKAIKALLDPTGMEKEWYGQANYVVKDARIVQQDNLGFTVEYDSVLMGEPRTATKRVSYTMDDITEIPDMKDTKFGIVSTYLGQALGNVERIMPGVVSEASILVGQEGKALNRWTQVMDEVTSGLDSKDLEQWSDILLKGDREMRVFTVDELRLQGHSDKIISGYYKARFALDTLREQVNYGKLKKLAFEGWQGAYIRTLPEANIEAAEAIQKASPGVSNVRPRWITRGMPVRPANVADISKSAMVYDPRTGRNRMFSEIVQSGDSVDPAFILVNTRNPINAGKNRTDLVLLPRNQLKELTTSGIDAIEKIPGYVPRMYTANYFVRTSGAQKVLNGVKTTMRDMRTVRAFETKEEAEAFAEMMNRGEGDMTKSPQTDMLVPKSVPQTKPYFVKRADETDVADLEDFEALSFGTPIGSSRSYRQELTQGFDGKLFAARLNAQEAIERNMSYVAEKLPMLDFRQTVAARFRKMAGRYLQDERNWLSKLDPNKGKLGKPSAEDVQAVRQLEALQAYLRDILRVPSEGERVWTTRLMQLAEVSESKGRIGKVTGKGLRYLSGKSIWGIPKSVAFNTQLGMFNVGQFFVQSLGSMVLTASLRPQHAMRAMRDVWAVHPALMYAIKGDDFGDMHKLSSLSKSDFNDLITGMKQSGIAEMIRSNADYNPASLHLHMNRGMIPELASKHTIFFSYGELTAKTYAYLAAFYEWRKLNPKKAFNVAEQQKVFNQMNHLSMNMTRANKAWFQRGPASIPTQYYQVWAKFVEDFYLGTTGRYTGGERARAILGQMVIFGAYGVPFSTIAYNGVQGAYKAFTGEDMDPELSEEWKASIHGGLAEALVFGASNERIDVSARLNIASGISTFLKDSFTEGGREWWEMALGASQSPIMQSWHALKNVGQLASTSIKSIDDPQTVKETFYEFTNDTLAITSSWSNLRKANAFMELKAINRKGELFLDQKYIDNDEAWVYAAAQMFGMTPVEITEVYAKQRSLTDLKDERTEDMKKLKVLARNHMEQSAAAIGNDEELQRLQRKLDHNLAWILSGYPEDTKRKMWANATKSVFESPWGTKTLDEYAKKIEEAGETVPIGVEVPEYAETNEEENP